MANEFLRELVTSGGLVTGGEFAVIAADDLPRVTPDPSGTWSTVTVDQWGRVVHGTGGGGGGVTTLANGGTGSDLSAAGPGVVVQAFTGSPLSVTTDLTTLGPLDLSEIHLSVLLQLQFGGTAADLSASGPGLVYQSSFGAPLSVVTSVPGDFTFEDNITVTNLLLAAQITDPSAATSINLTSGLVSVGGGVLAAAVDAGAAGVVIQATTGADMTVSMTLTGLGTLTADAFAGDGSGLTGVTGGSAEFNEAKAADLVNGGSLFADQFSGSSLGGSWSVPIGTLSVNTVKNSVFASDIASGTAYVVRSAAPAGAFRVEGRFLFHVSASGHGLAAADSGASEGAMKFMCVDNSGAGTGVLRLLKNNAGSYTTVATVTIGAPLYGRWVYLRLDRDGSNNWTAYYSWDRVVWTQIGTASFTFTVARVGIRVGQAGVSSVDFIDVVS